MADHEMSALESIFEIMQLNTQSSDLETDIEISPEGENDRQLILTHHSFHRFLLSTYYVLVSRIKVSLNF